MTRIDTSALGTQAIAAGLEPDSGGRFSRTIRLSLPTGGVATRARVAPGTVLRPRFQARTVDALAPGAPEAATLSTMGGDLVLSLPVARQIRRVRLKAPSEGDRIAAFRFDGDVVSGDPVQTAVHGASGALLNVTDAALILKRKNGGTFLPLSAGAVDAVRLRYSPLNPRLALRLADETGPGLPFRTELDEAGFPVTPAPPDRGPDLAAALETLLGRVRAPLPDRLEIDLVLSADEPCSAGIDALNLSLVLETAALPEKTVLRFAGGRRDVRSVALDLPAGAVIAGGALVVTVTGTPPGEAQQDATLDPLPAAGGEGLAIASARPVATRLQLAAARTIAGAELVLAASEGPAELRAVLYADRDGQPGAALAESAAVSVTRATPSATAFAFPPSAVPAGAVWLGVEALTGCAVALLGGTGPLARTDGPAFVIFDDPMGRGLAAALRPVTASRTISTGGPSLSLGGAALPGLPSSGTAEIDLTAVATALAASPTLTISSGARATVTIAPPVIRYTLP
jgi:hypothetical protein